MNNLDMFNLIEHKLKEDGCIYFLAYHLVNTSIYHATLTFNNDKFYILTFGMQRERYTLSEQAYQRFIVKIGYILDRVNSKYKPEDICVKLLIEDIKFMKEGTIVYTIRPNVLNITLSTFEDRAKSLDKLIFNYSKNKVSLIHKSMLNNQDQIMNEVRDLTLIKDKTLRSTLEDLRIRKNVNYLTSIGTLDLRLSTGGLILQGDRLLTYEKDIYSLFNLMYQYFRLQLFNELLDLFNQYSQGTEERKDVIKIINCYNLSSVKTTVFSDNNNLTSYYKLLIDNFYQMPRDILFKNKMW